MEKSKPLISIVIPTFNRADELSRCLDSIRLQTLQNFEVLICDDGSTDHTEDVYKQFKKYFNVKYFKLENFGGPARPRNIGIKESSGKYIAFLDSDDWWVPSKLKESVLELEKGQDLIYHDLYIINNVEDLKRNKSQLKKVKTRHLKKPTYIDLLLNGTAITNSSVVVRRSLIESIGGFSEDKNLIAIEDFEAWLRCSKESDNFLRINKPLGFYWAGGGNISSSEKTIRNYKKLRELYEKDFITYSKEATPHWYDYDLSRAFLHSGKFNESLKNSRSALKKIKNIKIKIKYLLSYLQIIYKNYFKETSRT